MTISISNTGSIILVLAVILYLNEKSTYEKISMKTQILNECYRKLFELSMIPNDKHNFEWSVAALDLINDFICVFQSYGEKNKFKDYIENDVKQKQFKFLAKLRGYYSASPEELDELHSDMTVVLQQLSDRSTFL